MSFYRNHCNNTWKPKVLKRGSTSSVDRDAAERFFHLQNTSSGRELFASEQKVAHRQEGAKRRAEGDARPEHAIYQAVLKEMWDGLDADVQAGYEARARCVGDLDE